MAAINITGASQRVGQNGAAEWGACYVCHKCGEEFAGSNGHSGSEREAREESDTRFDRQQRRYCYRCGYALTTKDVIPESETISVLNAQIDRLEEKRRGLIGEAKQLRAALGVLAERLVSLGDCVKGIGPCGHYPPDRSCTDCCIAWAIKGDRESK